MTPSNAKDDAVEAVARAMARMELAMGDPEHEVQARVDDQWPLYTDLARAAIEAMGVVILPIPSVSGGVL